MLGGFRHPSDFFRPLVIGAPQPFGPIDDKLTLVRSIQFTNPASAKMRAKVPNILKTTDAVCLNLEDGLTIDEKGPGLEGVIEVCTSISANDREFWVRTNQVTSPWFLREIEQIVLEAGDKIRVIMLPKVTGPEEIFFADLLIAQFEARRRLARPIAIHAILETARGLENVLAIAAASPRIVGLSIGPADLAASLGMMTLEIGGGHPDYRVLGPRIPKSTDAPPDAPEPPRAVAQQDLWHNTITRMVSACRACGVDPFFGPFGATKDPDALRAQLQSAFVMGCVGAWSLNPVDQLAIVNECFTPQPAAVAEALRTIIALPNGAGSGMVDGKFVDDAQFKQCQVTLAKARKVAAREPEMLTRYEALEGWAQAS